uniref:C-type lectin domain-containing protein n=1 Tax=Panagrolaimus sp. JU765 TaxID=591449 RepID=A0AC34RIC7_9BILA
MKLVAVSFLLIFQLIFGNSLSSQCPQGSIASFSGDNCWYLISVPLDFIYAERYCLTLGGHLASIHKAYDNAFMTVKAKELFSQATRFAIGGNNLRSQKDWAWNDGSTFDFENWANYEPSNSTWKNCLHVDVGRGKWYTSECTIKVPFVCQKPLSNSSSTMPTP